VAQLDVLYGRANASTIIDNAQTKIALAGPANDGAELISRELGDTTIMIPRESRTDGGTHHSSTTRSDADSRRRLMTADEVRRLKEEEMTVIITNRRPLQLRRFHYTAEPQTAPSKGLGTERTVSFSPIAEPVGEVTMELPGFPRLN